MHIQVVGYRSDYIIIWKTFWARISVWAYVFVFPPYARTYLEGSHAELNTEAQINVEVVGQKIEEHVVGAKQRDEEEGGLSQTSVGQKARDVFTHRHASRRANQWEEPGIRCFKPALGGCFEWKSSCSSCSAAGLVRGHWNRSRSCCASCVWTSILIKQMPWSQASHHFASLLAGCAPPRWMLWPD